LSSNSVVLAGVIAADSANAKLSTNGYTANFVSINVSNQAVTVGGLTLTGSAAGNYSLTQPSLTASITTAPVTITSGITANNKVHTRRSSDLLSSNSVVLAGVIAADAANAKLSTNGYTANFVSINVSNQAVTVSGLSLTG